MKKAFRVLCPAAAQSATTDAPAANIPRYFYTHVVGSIDNSYPVVMNLFRVGRSAFGDYAYRRIGTPIALAG